MVARISVHAVVELVGAEYFVNGVCRGDHVLYECRSVFFGQLQHLGNVMIAGYDAAARMGLFLEKVNDRCSQTS